MKNITVSVDDEVYHLSRVRAAEAGTTVSALVRALLVRVASPAATPGTPGPAARSAEFERLERLQEEVIAELRDRAVAFHAGDRLTREGVHERSAVH